MAARVLPEHAHRGKVVGAKLASHGYGNGMKSRADPKPSQIVGESLVRAERGVKKMDLVAPSQQAVRQIHNVATDTGCRGFHELKDFHLNVVDARINFSRPAQPWPSTRRRPLIAVFRGGPNERTSRREIHGTWHKQ